MKTSEKLNQALENASRLEQIVKEAIREIDDYDLQRLLKKIDAEFMDVQHNLYKAQRLAEGLARKPQKKRRTKSKTGLR